VNIDGARDAAFAHGRMLAVYSTHGNAEIEQQVLDATLSNPNVLGVIYATVYTRRVSPPAALSKVPTVLLNCYASELNLSSVVPAEVAGGHTATDHLLNAGHRRIGYINGEPWQDAARDRLKGYRTALATADLPFAPELVREGDWSSGTGFEQTLSLMREPNPPTAIFCANDLMALGALDAARELKLAVPRELSLVGYDDQDMARYTHPPLTTVLLPNYEMGRWAAEKLIAQARGAIVSNAVFKSECPLVSRDSVAAPFL
jgi:LacI family transcriptional regulator